MDVIVTGRRCTISDDFRGKATERIQGIERFRDRVQRVEVQVSATQTKQPDQAMRVEITLDAMQKALDAARKLGGKVTGGARVEVAGAEGGYYARPALVEMPEQTGIVCEETFAPILYVMKYDDMEDAITQHNAVGAGLSSCIFTMDIREAETFVSAAGSDCGIANINIATSGAEIGGAFGGEKETGGGRESGSDAWKGYMRRATNTINYSAELPLAQGVSFDI